MPDDLYSALDPGIRDIVRLLHGAGFVTTDSGDGVTKPPDERTFDVPHVVCRVDDHQRLIKEAFRLWRTLPVGWRVEANFCPHDRVALLVAEYLPGGEARTDDAPPEATDTVC
ncbi:MAG: hypothetical protein KJ066_19585 [Acidobacteria bacterium]|nr:hypothetical protein [Acidobacteriota bacterium]